MRGPRPDEVEWTGGYANLKITEYFCPSKKRWNECSGPCPDGTKHKQKRIVDRRTKVMKIKDGVDLEQPYA